MSRSESASSPAPAFQEYPRRLSGYGERRDAAGSRARLLSRARLAVFGLLVVAGIGGMAGWWSGHLVWPFLAGFAVLVVLHQRADLVRFDAARRAALYERALARVEDRWAGEGTTGETWRPERHVYADDLDLFGKGSLFQLLCSARTRAGEEQLARWLLEPAAPDEVRARQEAVEDLRARVGLREEVAVVGGEVASALDRSGATAWGEAPVQLTSRFIPWAARILGIVSAVLCTGWILGAWTAVPLAASLVVQLAVTLPWSGRVEQVLASADRPSRDLDLVARLLRRYETASFEAPRLRDLGARLEATGLAPSRRIRRLVRLMDFVEARRNQIFLPISWLLALGTQLAFSIERWRAENGGHLLRWVEALGELEALTSLSAYAYEHPEDPFPELREGAAVLEGTGLGHPLLATVDCVRNDVALGGEAPQALLVSGSNMSGKSTLLRTLGVNVVLAQAGAPVRARSLTLTPLALGASIRVMDSLQGGESRFYAEIARLRRIVDISRDESGTLFLLDEVLHGTNSHDRRIGARAVIRTLLGAEAIGLVTTHDLALAELAEEDTRMANVHFQDELVEGRIRFDYRMREGVVTRSNAIALMRAVGLDIEE